MQNLLVRLFLLTILCAAPANAASNYKAYSLPGEAYGMRFKVFAYSNEKAKEVLDKAEDTYQRLLRSLGQNSMLFKDCLIFFWKDKEDFFRESKKLSKGSVSEWAAAFADYRLSKGEVGIFAYETTNIFSNILPHEITHQVLAQGLAFTGIPYIPLWLNEGIAQYMEEDKEARRFLISSAVREGKDFELKELTTTYAYSYPKENVSLFYAQSLSLVEFFLETYSGDKFYSLTRRLVKEKKPIEKALKGAYWPDIENLEELKKEWLTWIKGKYYYQKIGKDTVAETAKETSGYLPLSSTQREMIEEIKKKAKKADNDYIWTSSHFNVRMEYQSRKEMGIKDAAVLEDIYAATLFILEEAYNKIGEDMKYHPYSTRGVYLYAPKQYSMLKGSRSHEQLINDHSDRIVMEIKKIEGIRQDLVSFLYHYYARIALLNKAETSPFKKLHDPVAKEWERKGERVSLWNR